MKNTYTLKHPLNPAFESVLDAIIHVTSQLEIPYFIAGATARDLLLELRTLVTDSHGILKTNQILFQLQNCRAG